MSRRALTDAQWERIEGHLPGRVGTPGRSGVDNRLFVDAVLWMAGNAARWRDLPDVFGRWSGVNARFRRRSHAGVTTGRFCSNTVKADATELYGRIDEFRMLANLGAMTSPDDKRAALMTDLMRGVLKMSAIAHRAGTAMNREAGLTNARWILIDQAAEEAEPLTLSEHARRLGFSRQAIRRLTAEMEKEGLVELAVDPSDKRALTLTLTESGRRLQRDALTRGMAYNSAISEQVDPGSIREALDTVTRLTAAMIEREEGGY